MVYLIALLTVIMHGCYFGSRLVATLFALEIGANTFEVGVLAGLYALLSLLLAVYSGRLSDRLGPRTPMILGALLTFGALMIAYLVPALGALYASAAILGGAFILFNVSVQNLVGLISTKDNRPRNFSTLSQGYSISTLLAPLMAGYGIEYLGHVRTYLLLALLALVPALVLIASRKLAHVKSPAPENVDSMRVRDLLADRPLRRSFVTSGLVVTGWDLYTFYMPVHGHQIGMSASAIGAVLALFGAAAFIARVFLPPLVKRYTEPGLLERAMWVAGGLFLMYPLLAHVWWLAILSIGLGATLGLGQPLSMMITYTRAPAGRSGEANGLRLMVNHFTHFIVPIASGALGTALGLAPVFWLCALGSAGSARLLRRR